MDPIPIAPAIAPSVGAAISNSKDQPTLVRGLGLLDSVLLLVSGIIGSSIFLTAKDIAGPLPQPISLSTGLGAGCADLSLRMLCVCRAGLDVSRLRWTVHLSA